MKRLLLMLLWSGMAFGSATQVFITQNGAGLKNGTSLANAGNCDAVANTPQSTCAFFNNAANWGAGTTQIGMGTTVIASGTITASAGAGGYFNFQGSGVAGNVITLQITGTVQSTHWAANGGGSGCLGGAVCMSSRSFVTLDGASTGTIQNTDNGSALGSKVASLGIDAYACNSCTVSNITVANIYVNVVGNSTIGDSSIVRAIELTGSNWTIDHVTMHDCGWCIVGFFANGNNNWTISNNSISNMGHALALATSGANSFSNLFFFNNDIGATANWSAPGCFSHQDGIHMFGVAGSSIDNTYVYNNYFHGDWGTCPTGFVFVEAAGSGTPSNLKNSFWWNNVMIVNPGSPPDTSGWFELAQGTAGGAQIVVNNTMIGANNGSGGDNTACFVLQNLSGLTFKNNVVSTCGNPVTISSSTITSVNYNFYGPSCQNGGNCFVWNGAFKGSFAAWKTACSCDALSQQNNTPLLNADGSPQVSSPVIRQGDNLASLATGNLATLASDTTQGGPRATIARPILASCSPQGTSPCWDEGAYQFSSGPAVTLGPTALSFGSITVGLTSSPQTVTIQNTGTATLHVTAVAVTTGTNFAISGTTCAGIPFGLAPAASCTVSVVFSPVSSGAKTDTLVFTDDASDSPQSVPLTGTGVAATPAVSLSPISLSFGNQTINVPSAPQTVHLTNSGGGSLSISSIVLTTGTQFAILSSTCATSLGPGLVCDVVVTFTPTSLGAKSDSLVFTTNAASSPDTVSVSGTGVAAPINPSARFSGGVRISGGVTIK